MGVFKYTPNAAVQGYMGYIDREMIANNIIWHSYTLAQSTCKNWCFVTITLFEKLGMGFLKNLKCVQQGEWYVNEDSYG